MSINGSGAAKTVDYLYMALPSPNSPENVSLPMPGDTVTITKEYLTGTVTKNGPVYTFKGTKNSGSITTDINAVFACDL